MSSQELEFPRSDLDRLWQRRPLSGFGNFPLVQNSFGIMAVALAVKVKLRFPQFPLFPLISG
jgi:hypothetical protein